LQKEESYQVTIGGLNLLKSEVWQKGESVLFAAWNVSLNIVQELLKSFKVIS